MPEPDRPESHFRIRPAVLWEASQIYDIYQQAFLPLDARIDPPTSAGHQTVESLRKSFGRAGIDVCLLDNRIAGCIFYRPEDGGLYFYRLAVSQDHRRMGIATRLIRHVLDKAQANGLRHVSLNVRVELLENQQLFQSLGFTETSRHAHEGYDRDTYIRMEKRL